MSPLPKRHHPEDAISQEVRDYLDMQGRKQTFQSWWQTASSVIVGWLLGQFSLRPLLPHVIMGMVAQFAFHAPAHHTIMG